MKREEEKEIRGWIILLTVILLLSFIGFSQAFSLHGKERRGEDANKDIYVAYLVSQQ